MSSYCSSLSIRYFPVHLLYFWFNIWTKSTSIENNRCVQCVFLITWTLIKHGQSILSCTTGREETSRTGEWMDSEKKEEIRTVYLFSLPSLFLCLYTGEQRNVSFLLEGEGGEIEGGRERVRERVRRRWTNTWYGEARGEEESETEEKGGQEIERRRELDDRKSVSKG